MAVRRYSKGPYCPPKQGKKPLLSGVNNPSRFFLLSEAIEYVGRHRLEGEWTGEEICSGSLEFPTFDEVVLGLWQIGDPYNGLSDGPIMPRPPTQWKVCTSAGIQTVVGRERAEEIWREEKPKLGRIYQVEFASRCRFDKVAAEIKEALYAGILSSWARQHKSRELYKIPSSIWESEDFNDAFELDIDDQNRTNLIRFYIDSANGAPTEITGQVMLNGAELHMFVTKTADPPEAMPNETPPAYLASAEKKCEEWLERMDTEKDRPKRKFDLMKVAQKKFHGLSEKSFLRAWGSNAPDEWKRPGQKKRTLSVNRRP